MKQFAEQSNVSRTSHFETFEERLPMSADPVADFRLAPEDVTVADPQWMEVSTFGTVMEGHGWTDVATVRNDYGLRGGKQTVAVIDSGIAWDHVALGGGLGRAYRVVGGWDFAENDANPYDDGPAGFHGTHVSGIIGSSDGRYPGVAPDVDLVGLRVFDDQGNGYFTWVESALRWVHDHRLDFDNPITTVNLSLGAEWNAATLPNWATLEDEFQLLENDGIFISVAAGNSFKQFGAPGLSYPAASQYVVPVASVGANGLLSDFSQRDARVLAAPGEKIMSTLPDHFYGGDGVKNDMGRTSGTSMAAPYVAGASVLVREALAAMGYANINQDLIYDKLYATADIVYDSITQANYHRVNLERALQSIVGTDDFGSSVANANNLGMFSGSLTVSGTIGRLDDQDFFRFTAQQTGTVTFVMQTSGNLSGKWIADVGVTVNGNRVTFNVVAGQSYTVGLATQTGIGKYQLQTEFVAAPPVTPPPVTPPPVTPPPVTPPPGNNNPPPVTPPPVNPPPVNPPPTNPQPGAPTDLGVVHAAQQDDLQVTGERWFRVTAGRTGVFTAEAFYNQTGGNVRLEIYNAQKLLLRTVDGHSGVERIDFNAGQGGVYYVRLVGANANVDLRLTNMVQVSGNTATIHGTAGDDTLGWSIASGQHNVTVNGTTYSFQTQTRIAFRGNGGHDTLTLQGGAAAETVNLSPGMAQLRSASYLVTAYDVETINAFGGQNDRAVFQDNLGDRWLVQTGRIAVAGSSYTNTASGFGQFAQGPRVASVVGPQEASIHGAMIDEVERGEQASFVASSQVTDDLQSTLLSQSFTATRGDTHYDVDSGKSQPSLDRLWTSHSLALALRTFDVGSHSMQSGADDFSTDHALAESRSRDKQQEELIAVEGVFHAIGRDS